jgi:adenylate cyclase class 1
MAAFQNKLAPDFSEGVDRKLLKRVRDRFMQVNADRLQKTQEGLSLRQQDILKVLPVLYHVNHPLMPGYVSREVPYGISCYEPDKPVLAVARSFSQTFKYTADKRHKPMIHAIYMMGSTGTLAHSEQSDVDLWLCYQPGLVSEDIALLDEKARRIDAWANKLGLELHTFLMDADQFRQNGLTSNMDKESSGSAQHYLLLDEFYRTAILLAGRYPVWWLIPPAQENRYEELAELLLSKRFIKDGDVIDFGSAALIPKNELVGAALWQLYKGIDSPYKSVLKILLAEVYAQEMPARQSLSQTFKQAVYDDRLQAEDLDPYLLVYRRLEQYLNARKEHKRLDLVRKSFYLKVSKKLSRPPSGKAASWQRNILEATVRHWAWPDEKFRYLDNRMNWKVEQVIQERQMVVAELSHCYRFLSQFARGHGIDSSITENDLNLLGRKLYSVFQKKAGKVEFLNPGIASNLWEENLAIHHSSSQPFQGDANEWLLYRDLSTSSDASFESVIRKSPQLIELIAWLYINQILTQNTRLSFVPGNTDVRLYEVQSIIRSLTQDLPMPLPPVSQQAYQKKLAISRLLLFINVGVDPMKKMSERGMHRLSDRTDSLDYSSERQNLVKTIDQIAVNSWNEVMANRYEMGDTLMQNLQAYLQICQEQIHAQPCSLSVFCFCPQRAQAISARVEQLFQDIRQAFFGNGVLRPARYVIEVEKGYYVFQYVEEQFRYFVCEDQAALASRLMLKPPGFSPILLDRQVQLPAAFLADLLVFNLPDQIQLFYQEVATGYHCLVLDEYGSMLHFRLSGMQEEVLQSSLSRCLSALVTRRQMSISIGGESPIIDTRIYRIDSPDAAGSPKSAGNGIEEETERAVRLKVKEIKRIRDLAAYEVHVHGLKTLDDYVLDIALSSPDLAYKEFSSQDYGVQQFDAMLHFARHQAGYDTRLPFMIVEVTLSEADVSAALIQDQGMSTLAMFQVVARAQQGLFAALETQGMISRDK